MSLTDRDFIVCAKKVWFAESDKAAANLVYQWVKQGHINLREFMELSQILNERIESS